MNGRIETRYQNSHDHCAGWLAYVELRVLRECVRIKKRLMFVLSFPP